MSQRRQLGRRSDRARDKPRLVCGRKLLRDFPGNLRRSNVDLGDFILQVVFCEHYARAAKGICLDYIAADAQKTRVDILNDVGPAEDQKLIAALLAPKIIHTGIARLDIRTHSAVVDHDPLTNGL